MKKLLPILLIFSLYSATQRQFLQLIQAKYQAPMSLKSFAAHCASTKENDHDFSQSFVSFSDFKHTIDAFSCINQTQLNKSDWYEDKNPFKKPILSFQPFAQKLILLEGSKVAFFGDLHGNIHSLVRILNHLQEKNFIDENLKIIDPNFYFIFLGDFVDRGSYGVEVLHLLFKLKFTNPSRVFMVRGNHEDRYLNFHYGFGQELHEKFSTINEKELKKIYDVYNFLPTALYLGIQNEGHVDYIHCSHGGLELGYNPKEFLKSDAQFHAIDFVNRRQEYQKLSGKIKTEIQAYIPQNEVIDFEPEEPTQPRNLGHMWNDFNADADHTDFIHGRSWVYGRNLTRRVLSQHSTKKAKLCGVFRAHQHYGTMLDLLNQQKGIVSLWNGMVHTFLSVPIHRTTFHHDSLGLLYIGISFKDSKLEHLILD